jgi:Nucleotidyl transferase AbiEii toxin, Type IV TA system
MDRFKDIDTEDRVRLAAVRFWQRCDSLTPGSLIIKGAQALILRSGAARTTQDIDVQYTEFLVDDVVETLRDLIYAAADLHTNDGFTYKVKSARSLGRSDTMRADLNVKWNGRQLTRRLEVDFGYRRPSPAIVAEMLQPEPLCGERLPLLPLYPLPRHIADKVCAMFETIDGRESDRHHDLFDLIWIARTFDGLDRQPLTQALSDEQNQRKVQIPRPFTPPSTAWESGLDRLVTTERNRGRVNLANWPTYELAVQLVNRMLFAGSDGQRWNTAAGHWVD